MGEVSIKLIIKSLITSSLFYIVLACNSSSKKTDIYECIYLDDNLGTCSIEFVESIKLSKKSKTKMVVMYSHDKYLCQSSFSAIIDKSIYLEAKSELSKRQPVPCKVSYLSKGLCAQCNKFVIEKPKVLNIDFHLDPL